MKKLIVCSLLAGLSLTGFAQTDSTQTKSDTIRIGGMVIIRDKNGENKRVEREERDNTVNINFGKRNRDRAKNISTNWFIVDLGFSNYTDKTDYASTEAQDFAPGSNESWMDLKDWKSRNVNIWIFMQKLNVAKNVVNLKYGLGLELNNYHFKQPINFDGNPPAVANPAIISMDNVRSYSKNKLAADYITVPLMLNFDFTPKKSNSFGFSIGASAGYLYSARNKTKTSQDGKQKVKDDFGLEPWKISYIAELSLGPIRLYGSVADKSMFKRGMDITPYNVGIRLSNW